MYPKLHFIRKITPEGKVSTKGEFCNNETARYNMQSFIMEKFYKCSSWFNEDLRNKADKEIKESRYTYKYEDSEGNIYTIRKNPI